MATALSLIISVSALVLVVSAASIAYKPEIINIFL